MRQQLIDSLLLAKPGFVESFIASVRIVHGITAILPGVLLAFFAPEAFGLGQNYVAVLLFFAVLTVLMFEAVGIYSEQLFSTLLRFRITFFAWSAAFCLLLFMHQALALFQYIHLSWLALWFFMSLCAFGAERLVLLVLFRRRVRAGKFLQHSIILGANENGQRLAAFLQNRMDVRSGLLGFIDDRTSRVASSPSGLPVLGDTAELEKLVRSEKVSLVMIALPWSAESRIGQIVRDLRRLPVNVLLAPDMVAFRHAQNRITEVGGLPMFNVSQIPLTGWSPLIKRCEDLLIASLLLLVLAPVIVLLSVLIKLDSPGPVLFRQKRYGYNNQLIEVFKFRSMYHHHSDANAEQQTTRGDARITRIGRFIRRTSLDELPQLFNVLLGNMSMVGPRPHATATKAEGILFEDAVKEYTSRHRVKPGITGWAQVKGYRGETDTLEKIEKRVEYDLDYIERWSVWFDLYILLRTFPAVLFSKEAY